MGRGTGLARVEGGTVNDRGIQQPQRGGGGCVYGVCVPVRSAHLRVREGQGGS